VRLGWLTDLHLNFAPGSVRAALRDDLRSHRLDALAITGDIGEARTVIWYLEEMASELAMPIYFVLGNHDFYRGSMAAVREAVERKCAQSQWLRWMPANGVVTLTGSTALIGHDSWADGRCGDFFHSTVELNDYYQISELLNLDRAERYARLNALGDEAAAFLEARLREAIALRPRVLALTHVPPFRESCWHEGRISADDWLPHFACRAVGERLAEVMTQHPDRSLTVLCGHTHGGGEARILENLLVLTGGAEYGSPRLQRVIEVE